MTTRRTGSDLLTPLEAADYLACRVEYVYRLIYSGRLSATKLFGTYWRIHRHDLDAAVEAGKVEAWR